MYDLTLFVLPGSYTWEQDPSSMSNMNSVTPAIACIVRIYISSEFFFKATYGSSGDCYLHFIFILFFHQSSVSSSANTYLPYK